MHHAAPQAVGQLIGTTGWKKHVKIACELFFGNHLGRGWRFVALTSEQSTPLGCEVTAQSLKFLLLAQNLSGAWVAIRAVYRRPSIQKQRFSLLVRPVESFPSLWAYGRRWNELFLHGRTTRFPEGPEEWRRQFTLTNACSCESSLLLNGATIPLCRLPVSPPPG